MRRSARGEQSSAFSLFPFLAVLLCTMGALVVLLVAMANVSRDKAAREAAIAEQEQLASASPDFKVAQEHLDLAKEYEKAFAEKRSEVELKLAEEQKRLTGIEDHIRRMRSEVESLQAEAMEIIVALEETHMDDHEVAKLELKRLNELIDSIKDENAELAQLTTERQRRYAIVPLREGSNGTRRPAIYFECLEDRVILQPEGIEFPQSDFARPVHVSSPLAAAMRTIQQFYINNPEVRAEGEVGAPYALVVVRPDGIDAYNRVSHILESIDADYGFQPVADDWPIEYENPNPQLAEEVFLAIELARQDRIRLASAAPQLFKQADGGWDNPQQDPFDLATRGNSSKASQNPFAGVSFNPNALTASNRGTLPGKGGPSIQRPFGGDGGDKVNSGGDSDSGGESKSYTDFAEGEYQAGRYNEQNANQQLNNAFGSETPTDPSYKPSSRGFGPNASSSLPNVAAGNGKSANEQITNSEVAGEANEMDPLYSKNLASNLSGDSSDAANSSPSGSPASATSPQPSTSGPGAEQLANGSPAGTSTAQSNQQNTDSQKDGRPGQGPPSDKPARTGIAMRRTIQLAVEADQIKLLTKQPKTGALTPKGSPINTQSNPANWMPALLQSLKNHAESWGIAGDGMYWKPSLVLRVAPGAETQANQLTSVLEQSGVEVRQVELAKAEGGYDATRR